MEGKKKKKKPMERSGAIKVVSCVRFGVCRKEGRKVLVWNAVCADGAER